MADEGHRKVLSGGVAGWNAWRRMNPEIIPDLSGSNIKVKDLAGIDLSGADLHRALLTGADLSGAHLESSDLSGSDMMEANLEGAWLNGADLRGANLMGANLQRADLTGVRLDNAILYRADLKDCECAANALWLQTLMDFADGLIAIDEEEGAFEFDDLEGTAIRSSFVSTRTSRLELVLSDPVSAKASHDILGALNRLYSAVARRDLPGPLIQIGLPGGSGEDEEGEE
ncbi:MAG TPA: pentapeptide repeat-containing protein [Candidatus Krumholzibacterium sp.]|nr:pentapeptide repeat-containing protein [Candidatus Krumholzibacterium sp.]